MNTKRIIFHTVLLVGSMGAFLQQMASPSPAQAMRNEEQIIRISASTFDFTPNTIILKKGVPVTLEFTSHDRHHGFKLPEFHLRAEMQPGSVEKIRFVPDRTGDFTFFCDVFCDDGHEEMSGTLRVVEQ